jgi:hypothetical protein
VALGEAVRMLSEEALAPDLARASKADTLGAAARG